MMPRKSQPDPPGTDRQGSQILGIIILAVIVLLLASLRFYFKLS